MFANKTGVVRFGDATPIVDFFKGIGNTLKGAWDDWTGNTANRENIQYQQEYNEKVFNRADTEYERAVLGLRRAGLSPQLAAGNPASVAGASQAPERTVGNESAAIERLVGLVNSIKETNSNVALASAQADAARADASDKAASAALKTEDLGTYSERHSIEMALKSSNIAYNSALTRIAQLDGQTYMTRLESKLNYEASQTSYNKALIDLAKKDLEVRDSQIALNEANIEYYGAKVSESNEERKRIRELTLNLQEERKNLQQDFYNKVKEGLRLDAQTSLLLQQACNAKIEGDTLQYNLDMSKYYGLRTNDQQSRFMGINLGVDSAVSSVVDWAKNWKGVLGWPSWNEIFGGQSKPY